ncbi:putative ribonuclease H-like domain-containing protein [Tanacetum coccineum]
MPDLEDAFDTLLNDGIFNGAYDDDKDVGAVADFHNMDNTMLSSYSHTRIIRISKRTNSRRSYISSSNKREDLKGFFNTTSLSKLHSQKEQNKPQGSSELNARGIAPVQVQRFGTLWICLLDKKGKLGTKWVFRNKRDERSIVVKNKARLVAQGHRQEEGIVYDEVSNNLDGILISQDKYVADIPKISQTSPKLGYGILGIPPFEQKRSQIVNYADPVLDRNQQCWNVKFLGRRLQYLWQWQKQTLWQITTTEGTEYVAASSLLWASTMDTKPNDGLWL